MMKKYLQLLPALALLVITVACDGKSQLAEKISGSWAGSPEKLVDTDLTSGTIINVMEFVRTPGSNGGQLTMSGLLNFDTHVPQSSGIVQPISYSASGVATIQGEWTVEDDDDILIYLNGSTLTCEVDPEAVVLNYNLLSGQSAPQTDFIKPALAAQLKQQMKRAVETRFFNAKKIEDIKIKDNMMSCEINKHDLTMRRQ